MRAARDALGLKRLELYAHPDDWPAIKALAEKLQRRRAKLVAMLKVPNTQLGRTLASAATATCQARPGPAPNQ